jgi:hypothetical protein
MKTISGYRFLIKIPRGFQTETCLSRELYKTKGAAIDAMTELYPPHIYNESDRSIIPDDEIDVESL